MRRSTGLGLSVLLLVLAVVFLVRSPGAAVSGGRSELITTGSTVSSAPTDSSSTSAAPSATSTPSATTGTEAAPTTGPSSGTGSASTSTDTSAGPGRTAAGVQLIGQPRSDGSWDVVEYVRLTSPATSLKLTLPSIALLGGQFSDQTARVTSLQATAGDQVAGVVGSSGSGWQVESATPVNDFQLRYVLGGATVRSVPSKAGRALTALGPIADPDGVDVPVEIVTSGSTVRTVQCPLLSGDQQLCQAGEAPTIRVAAPLPRGKAISLVQFDLPAPS